MHDFTPGLALLGGALIGIAASAALLYNGRLAGISGIFAGLLDGERGADRGARSGLCPGPALATLVTGAPGFLLFVATMAAGAIAANRLEVWRRVSAAASAEADTAKPAATESVETTCG